jgi:FixJ family two-component response regulator
MRALGEGTATRKRVVVVDDDSSILGAIERALKIHGFDAEVFDKVEDFLDRAHLKEAACLVLDINLNGESGIELSYRLARSGHSLPVIFITAGDSEVTRAAALKAGCVAYLPKPFPSRSLVDAIEKSFQQTDPR